MGINIQAKNDYSTLFSSLNSSSNNSINSLLGSNANLISDYNSIKSGSYGKLLKAYYAKEGSSDEVSKIAKAKTTQSGKDSADTLTKIQSSAKSLKESSDKLSEADFNNAEESLDSVKKFVSDYNQLLKNTEDSNTSTITNKIDRLVSLTKTNKDNLSSIGISIKDDNSLSLDQDKFKTSDMSKAKDIFTGLGSYGYSVASQASMTDYQAGYEALRASTYTNSGNYSSVSASGNILDSLM